MLRKVGKALIPILVILGLVISAAFAPSTVKAKGGIQPILQEMAASRPQTIVGVIVQKAGGGQGPEELVRRLGGVVTKDLTLINAFAAQLPAGMVERLAAHPQVRWVSFDAPVVRQGGTNTYLAWATAPGTSIEGGFKRAGKVYDSYLGPNGTYGSSRWTPDQGSAAFSGFSTLDISGQIEKVEAVLYLYLSAPLKDDDVCITSYLDGVSSSPLCLRTKALNKHVGLEKAGYLYLDLTATRGWSWSDFHSGLELQIHHQPQGKVDGAMVYYDAVGYRITFLTEGSEGGLLPPALAEVPGVEKVIKEASGNPEAVEALLGQGDQNQIGINCHWPPFRPEDGTIDLSRLENAYNFAIGATTLWNGPERLQGQGIRVAVVDSGILWSREAAKIFDLGDGFPPRYSRVVEAVNFSQRQGWRYTNDEFGHGTHIAGIIGGNGLLSWGRYIGIAPKVDLINVKVSNEQGMGYESDVVAGLQWVYENRDKYNIRVVNISLNSSVPQSYHQSPLDAAVEILWFNRIVVVVCAGNNAEDHNGILYPPANDPFVITVGATDDKHTRGIDDDVLAHFSAYGLTEDGFPKPDLVAPGTNIVSISPGRHATLVREHPDHMVDWVYFRMSGTSMASAVTSGAVALLLQAEPGLNPDQVKYRLMQTTEPLPSKGVGAGYLNIYNAVQSDVTDTANTGQVASQLLWTGPEPPAWDSVHWDSVHWDSVHWDSVHWDSVHWDSVHWDRVYWGSMIYPSSISWD